MQMRGIEKKRKEKKREKKRENGEQASTPDVGYARSDYCLVT
jgi:hypothetical protein